MGLLDTFRNEKTSINEKENHIDLAPATTRSLVKIPDGAPIDPVTGAPTFAGLCGNKLINAVSATATVGFLLFGYDQGVMAGLSEFYSPYYATVEISTAIGQPFRDLPHFLMFFFSPAVTGAQFIEEFPANDAAIQGETRAALLQAT